jgi:hypothetical protein
MARGPTGFPNGYQRRKALSWAIVGCWATISLHEQHEWHFIDRQEVRTTALHPRDSINGSYWSLNLITCHYISQPVDTLLGYIQANNNGQD